MQPFERLRSIARWADDDGALVSEAADCLAAFDDDPAGLVVACRRLLAHNPASGPLWWLCARVLCAPDPAEAAWEAWRLVSDDPTAERLAALLPFPHDEPVAVIGWPPTVSTALVGRPDLDLVVVTRRGRDDHLSRRLRTIDQPLRIVPAAEAVAAEPTHVLFEAMAVGGGRAIVAAGTTDVVAGTVGAGGAAWLVAGEGRVLPDRLFEVLAGLVAGREETETLSLDLVARVAGPRGLDAPNALARRADCPVAPELLRGTR